MQVRQGTPADAPRALEIWRAAVDATHGFLTREDRIAIDATVAGFLPEADLWLVDDAEGRAVGFLILGGRMIEALFVDPAVHGKGFGSALIAQALSLAPDALVDANEQASNALPFYLAKGFVRIGRSERDGDGRPYPIIHLAYGGATAPKR